MKKTSSRKKLSISQKRVAVLVDTSTTWGRKLIEGVNRFSQERGGWELFVEPRGLEQRRWLPMGWQGDGVIARVGLVDLAQRLKRLQIPVVNVSAITLPKVKFPRVISDQSSAARIAAEHLVARGFRSFGYFSQLELDYVQAHQNAFAAALKKWQYPCRVYSVADSLALAGNDDMKRLVAWLQSLPKPVAMFTWNSSGARDLIYACQRAGLAVPEEVAVLSGSDDHLFCEVTPVPISAVELDSELIGYTAARELERMMEPGDYEPKEIWIAPRGVVERRSTDSLAHADSAMVKALQAMRSDLSKPLSVDDLARLSGLSRRALELRFQRLMGQSPAVAMRRIRVEHAISLLRQTNLSVAQVADRCGFSSPEYMASVFREVHGASPLHFRKKSEH
ncbi:MAG: helix-turn-helix domain-containing protein [Verrucomicrobia bacterium]|nr:MAG: helix-turn-helix domain-containing protein [Verrucomicrobiota bacterium]